MFPKKFSTNKKIVAALGWILLLGGVAFCYWPGLSGGFVFDDDANILQNINLRVSDASWQNFWSASVSGNAGPLGRPVALLTFAINYYIADGFFSFQFKFVNLLIHLINSILIGIFAQIVCCVIVDNERPGLSGKMAWAGWVVALLWALHPLNLTAVLYVVQRMTSLCTLFGMAGLAIYSCYRYKTYSTLILKRPVSAACVSAVAVGVLFVLSALSKETGVLFAPLLFLVEWQVFRFRYKNEEIYIGGLKLRWLLFSTLILLTVWVAIFKLPSMIGESAFANRDFSLVERILTQARVLIFYLRMLLVPKNSSLSLYHDDFETSRAIFDPPATAISLAILLSITIFAFYMRKRFAVLLFGWMWFLISHLLESTVFPLELVYEHRNYFAIIGLLFAVPICICYADVRKFGVLAICVVSLYVGLLGFVTYVRSMQWSNTVDWAALEAENRPGSMRANYELARVYIALMNVDAKKRFGEMADESLKKAASNDPTSLLPLVARVQLSYMRGMQPGVEDVLRIKKGFALWKYRNVNTAILKSLMLCQLNKVCHMQDEDFLEVLQAAFDNSRTPKAERAEILKLMAQYQINKMDDLGKGIELIEKSIETDDSPASYIMYAQALAMNGDLKNALTELEKARERDRRNEYATLIEKERENIEASLKK